MLLVEHRSFQTGQAKGLFEGGFFLGWCNGNQWNLCEYYVKLCFFGDVVMVLGVGFGTIMVVVDVLLV